MPALTLSVDQQARLDRFADLVAASPHNLVSRRAREELHTRHIAECVGLAALLPTGTASLLDVGSGGGFPGIVLAIVRPELAVTLLEATAKKAAFLREATAALDLDLAVVHGRAEDHAVGPMGGAFDLVTARAVAPLVKLIPWCLPFLRPDGLLYAVKGARWRDELAEAAEVLRRSRGRVVATPEDVPQVAGIPSTATVPHVVIIARA